MRLSPNLVYILHILLVAPFFAYIGWTGRESNENVFIVCKVLSIVIALYHTYLLLKNNSQDNFNEMSTYKKIYNQEEIDNLFKNTDVINEIDIDYNEKDD